MANSADRNLLFGILALQLDFINRDQLVAAMNAWVLDKTRALGDVLLAQQALRPDLRSVLETMVEKHLEFHDNDPQRSLGAVAGAAATCDDLRFIVDPDVQASLVNLGATLVSGVQALEETTAAPARPGGARFVVVRHHAQGGLGDVFVAHDTELNREVALKEIQVRHAHHAEYRARFLMEAEITGGLEHPNIVPVYGLGTYPDGRPYYAMRFIRGDSLKDVIKRYHSEKSPQNATLLLHDMLRRFIDVCLAIQYAHDRGVVHRDIKPANIMLGKYGETLVVDWGLAKPQIKIAEERGWTEPVHPALDDETLLRPTSASSGSQTMAGCTVGTPQFMSPEQANGRVNLQGPRSDIYSLGATLYAVLTGKAPIQGRDAAEMLYRAQRAEIAPPRQVKPGIAPGLEAICMKALARVPSERYESARALGEDIERWLADEPVKAWPEPWNVRLGRKLRRHRALASAAAAALLVTLVAAGAGLFWYQAEQHRDAQRRLLAAQAVREALDQGDAARAELADLLHKPGDVFTLVNRPAAWEGKIKLAQAAVERARAVAAAETALDAALAERLERLQTQLAADERDRLFAARLEKIRLDTAIVRERQFDFARAAREYPRAFAEFGYSVAAADMGATATKIAAAPIKEQLVASLDDWAAAALFVDDGPSAEQALALARQAAPDPAWGDRLRRIEVWRDQDALTRLLTAAPAAGLSAHMMSLVGLLLAPDNPLRERWLRDAQARYPADFWINLNLAHALSTSSPVEAIGFCNVCRAVRPDNPVTHYTMGTLLMTVQRPADAVTAFRKAIELEPAFAWAHVGLGDALHKQKLPAEALASLRAAVAADPNHAYAHYALGSVLAEQGKLPEAAAALRRALELEPDHGFVHSALGAVLHDQGNLPGAIEAYRAAVALAADSSTTRLRFAAVLLDAGKPAEAVDELNAAIALDPKSGLARYRLGNALRALKKPAEASAAYRQAVELDPTSVRAHNELGNTLLELDRPAEALPAYRRAAELDPRSANARYGAGACLMRQGELAPAAEALESALDVMADDDALRPDIQRQLRLARRALALEQRLPALLDGKESADADELLEVAPVLHMQARRFVSAVRFYQVAFKARPSALDDRSKHHRYNAACAAVLAATGLGANAAALSAEDRASMRATALQWLAADLDTYRKMLPHGKGEAQRDLTHWQQDADLASVRDESELSRLPPEERAAWRKLWADVDVLRRAAS